MGTPVPPRCDTDHNFATIQNDSGKRPEAACWRSDRIRTSAVRNRLKRIYSPLMFAALRIGHHFSISALW
jgi:hypothetical protein